METLVQYGIKDVTPGNSVGIHEKMRGEFNKGRYILQVWQGETFRGILFGAKYAGKRVGGASMYGNDHASVWLDEVRYTECLI